MGCSITDQWVDGRVVYEYLAIWLKWVAYLLFAP